jgi:WD40 repeat protein
MDYAHSKNLCLAGQEDGTVLLYDFRKQAGAKSAPIMTLNQAHENKWVSQVKVNPRVEEVFLSAGYDGKIKMWDMRN